MDVFTRLSIALVQWIDSFDPRLLSFFPHAVVFLGLPYLLCILAHQFVGRFQIVQLVCIGLGMFIAGTVPVPDIGHLSPVGKAWAVGISVFLIFLLPAALARSITRNRHRQASIILMLYLLTGFLFLQNFAEPFGMPFTSFPYPANR